MDTKLHNDLMILAGHTYKNGKFILPANWQELTSFTAGNGFQATVYKNDNEIAISYRGTDSLMDFILSDIPMGTNILPIQFKEANEVYQQIKQQYPNANITLTGHSLGGSLAQLVSAENGCCACTFNAYGTNDILNNAGIYNTKELNIINYGNINDPVFNSSYTKHPGRNFVTNTELNPDKIYEVGYRYNIHQPAHKIEYMNSLDDAVEIEAKLITASNNPFQLYAEKTFTREDIARMSNDEFAKNEQIIMQQLKNGQIKTQKPDYSNFSNPITGSKKIYTKEELDKMSSQDFIKKENEIMAQLQSIGIPAKCDLPKSYTGTSGQRKWVTINGKHVLINK